MEVSYVDDCDVTLQVAGCTEEEHKQPVMWEPAPAGHVGLQWLKVADLPCSTVLSMLHAHRHTLQELWLLWGSLEQLQYGGDMDVLAAMPALRKLHFVELPSTAFSPRVTPTAPAPSRP